MVVCPVGMTDSTAEPSVSCWIVKLPVTWLPVVTSVARMVAICVDGVDVDGEADAAPLPFESVTTVSVDASGSAGLLRLDRVASGDDVEADLAIRRMPAPPGPVTMTVAVPVPPEQRLLRAAAVAARQ